eukprot:scaffold15732_cov137-Isochrysis_galbana.AAC.6
MATRKPLWITVTVQAPLRHRASGGVGPHITTWYARCPLAHASDAEPRRESLLVLDALWSAWPRTHRAPRGLEHLYGWTRPHHPRHARFQPMAPHVLSLVACVLHLQRVRVPQVDPPDRARGLSLVHWTHAQHALYARSPQQAPHGLSSVACVAHREHGLRHPAHSQTPAALYPSPAPQHRALCPAPHVHRRCLPVIPPHCAILAGGQDW